MPEMMVQVHECSVIVLADLHNPTILHPEFLKTQGIVPSEWEPKANETVCSLPFSRVAYTNGIVVMGQPDKLRIIDTEPGADIASSAAPDVADRYVGMLPHVKHTAIGFNFETFLALSDPTAVIVSRFIKNGPWIDEPLRLAECGVRLQYALDIARVTANIDVAKQQEGSGESKPGVLLKVNYHNDIVAKIAEDSSAEVRGIISRYGEFCSHFAELSGVLMSGGT